MVGSPGQNGPILLAVRLRIKTSNKTGVPGQFVELVSITSTAFGINPGTPPQSTVIEFVPCPVWRVPPFIDHWYVEPTVFVTKYCSPTEFTHTVSGLIVV